MAAARAWQASVSAEGANEATRLMSAISYLRSAMMPAVAPLSTASLPPLFEILDDGTARDLKPRAAEQLEVGRAFAGQVLHTAPTLAVSSAPGVDPRVIHHHSRRAMSQFHLRDATLTVILGAALVLRPLPTLAWLVAFAVWTYPVKSDSWKLRALRWCALAAAAGLVADLYVRDLAAALYWSSPLLVVIAAGAVFVTDAGIANRRIHAILNAQDAPTGVSCDPRPGSRLERIVAEHHGTAVAYDQSHIIGVGSPVYSAPINIKLVTKDKLSVSRLIEPGELLARITEALEALRKPGNVRHGIEDLEVTGVRVGTLRDWAKEPIEQLTQSHEVIVNLPVAGRSTRAYVRARAVLWNGQIVPSVYVGAALEGDLLRFIFRQYVLHPIGTTAQVCRDVADSRPSGWNLLRHAAVELLLLGAGLRGAVEQLRTAPAPRHRSGASREEPVRSLRETYAQRTRDLHMTEDAARFLQNVTVTVFGEAIAFLESCGVDVSEFKRQAQTVINTTIGGDVIGSNVQMGDGKIHGGQIVQGRPAA